MHPIYKWGQFIWANMISTLINWFNKFESICEFSGQKKDLSIYPHSFTLSLSLSFFLSLLHNRPRYTFCWNSKCQIQTSMLELGNLKKIHKEIVSAPQSFYKYCLALNVRLLFDFLLFLFLFSFSAQSPFFLCLISFSTLKSLHFLVRTF